MRSNLEVCLLSCLLLAPSAFGQKIKIDYDHEANFDRLHTYEWRTHPVFEKNPQLQEVYATGIQLVLEAGNAQLRKQGLHPADVSPPDVFVAFFLAAQDAQRTTTTFVDPGPWWGPGYGWYALPSWSITETEYYKTGMLVIDIVDAGTSQLLWRAYCGDEITDWRNRHKIINAAVKKALGRFPPRSK